MYKRILVPLDGSDAARRGLEEAIKLAKVLGARIRLVNVAKELSGIPADLVGIDSEGIVEDLRRNGEAILSQALKRAQAEAVDADSRLFETSRVGQSAGPEILRCAEEWPADLIVCGTHGRRGIRRILTGSDAEFIARHSAAPVLLIRAQTPAAQGTPAPVAA